MLCQHSTLLSHHLIGARKHGFGSVNKRFRFFCFCSYGPILGFCQLINNERCSTMELPRHTSHVSDHLSEHCGNNSVSETCKWHHSKNTVHVCLGTLHTFYYILHSYTECSVTQLEIGYSYSSVRKMGKVHIQQRTKEPPLAVCYCYIDDRTKGNWPLFSLHLLLT